ncbi:DNA mismatch repair protein MutH [Actinobacillus equuli]|nr:DNA mismatch repair protein MutH [Actinobacillus equuli]
MQLRPKGRNSRSLTSAINQQGERVQSLPLGFYLRKQFTAEILQNFYVRPFNFT